MRKALTVLLMLPLLALASERQTAFDELVASAHAAQSWTNGLLNDVAMTNNSTPPFIVAANREYFAAYKAFDKNAGTFWDNYPSVTGWLKIDFGSAKVASSYVFTPYTPNPEYCPKAWTFEGSNDGESFTVLDTVANQTNWTSSSRTFSFSNGTAYRFYKWNFTDPNSANEYGLGEIEIFGRIYK